MVPSVVAATVFATARACGVTGGTAVVFEAASGSLASDSILPRIRISVAQVAPFGPTVPGVLHSDDSSGGTSGGAGDDM